MGIGLEKSRLKSKKMVGGEIEDGGKVIAARIVSRVEARCMLLLPPSGSGSAGKAGPLLFSYPKGLLLNLWLMYPAGSRHVVNLGLIVDHPW